MNKALVFLLLLLCFNNLAANGPSHSFIHITRKDGLASNDVYDIVQDEKGFYWVATDNGLQRYDGKRWVQPASGDPLSLSSRPIHQLMVLNSGYLILKQHDELVLFNTTNFAATPITVRDTSYTRKESELWKDSKGRIFLLLKGNGILIYNVSKNEFTSANLPIKMPADWRPLSIFEDVFHHRYWVSSIDGIAVYDENNRAVYHSSHNPLKLPFLSDKNITNVTSLFIDHSRKYWIAYGNSRQFIACYSETENKYLPEAANLSSFYKGNFYIDRFHQTVEKEMWLYGKSALFNYIPEGKSFFNNKSDVARSLGARFSEVRTIMQDREKGIWIATDEGLYQFYTVLPEVRNVVLMADQDDNRISAVQELSNGDIWMSSRGKGILVTDSNHQRVKVNYLFDNVPAADLQSVRIAHTLFAHKSTGTVWIGCDQGLVLMAEPGKRTASLIRVAESSGEPIASITGDASGKLYFATRHGDLVSTNYTGNRGTPSFQKLISLKAQISKLVVDDRQQLWICTDDQGLFCYDPGKGRIVRHLYKNATAGNAIFSNRVNAIVQLNDSVYALSTGVFELLNLSTNTIRTVSSNDGLLSNTIIGMEKDRQGYLWLATSNGICRYNLARNRFTIYEEKDGFMKFETVGASSTTFANGKIMFAGSNYFVTFPPHHFNLQQQPPSVIITDFKVLNSFIPLDSASTSRIELSPDNNSVSIFFSAMSYLYKDKLNYYFRLKGIQDDWSRADIHHAAVYTLLPSGSYVFEVRCENEEGASSPVTTFSFLIKPPFWKTWWFVALVIAALGAILFVLHRLRVNRILAVSDLRNRVARDLHDDVGSTLSTISILSTIAKGKLAENPAQAEQYINRITDNSQQMMDAMDDIVWSIKPMNDSMQKIIARMREFASGALEPKNIDIDFYVDERVPELKLNMESRRDLFLIFKEAVNNIAKYSQASNVNIQISYVQKRLMLKIKDNGIGFETETADNGNGISNMKKRAAMLNGRIKWFSDEQRGTSVMLNIPVND